jgi:4-amino-4-deoxy-L-arabinose transferase-like glycosyltransferase
VIGLGGLESARGAVVDPARSGSQGSVSRRARAAPLGVTAIVGALVAWWAAYRLLPNGSYNLDELVYLNQAEALRHGRLTYDAASYVPDFRPYLSGVADDRVVFKYQPLWPTWLALSQALTGDHRPALVGAGMAAASAFWLLGRELTGNRWLGTAMAVAVAVSPVFVAHSGTALAYLPAAALVAGSLGALLRGVRTGSAWWLAAGGAGLGTLFFHRPFDAALAGAPVGAWLSVRAWRQRRWRAVAIVGLAVAPFVVAWVGYNLVTSGEPLTPAFSIDAPSDRFGFGRRASWEATGETFEDGAVFYDMGGAWRTVRTFGLVTPAWIAGGVVSVALAGAALVLGRGDSRRWVLLSTIVLVVVGYFFWWGTENFVNFGMHGSLGPAYWLVGLGPVAGLATLGARDVVTLMSARPRGRQVLRAAVAGFVAMTLAGEVYVVHQMGEARGTRAEQLSAVGAAPAGSVLLFPTGVHDPFLRTLAPADLDGTSRLHAVDLDTVEQRFRLRDRFPQRALWAWLQERPAGTALDAPDGYALVELTTLRSPEALVDAEVHPGAGTIDDAWLRTLDGDGVELQRVTLDPSTDLGPVPAVPSGAPGPGLAVGSEPGWLAIGATVEGADGRSESVEVRWMVRARAAQLDIIGPGLGHRFYEFPDTAAWLQEDVSDRLTAAVDGLPPARPVRTIGPRS